MPAARPAEPAASFHVLYDEKEPISINRAYIRGPHGRVTLSAEGRAFKASLSAVVSAALPWDWGVIVDRAYTEPLFVQLDVAILFPDFHVKAWKKARKKHTATGERITTLPYQKKDGSNYIKLIEDAVAEATGIDDSFHLNVHVTKAMGVPGAIIIDYKVWPDRDYGTHGK